ncbi:hypothetical protein H0H93_007853 [Arthromyces matolae]|nr:hypothetical protein H0H93_007853 [Arthromyces matolae]
MPPSHRKRTSALRLSSDTTHSLLPVYAVQPLPDDNPPGYPHSDSDSAQEADNDSDNDDSELNDIVYVPPPPPTSFSLTSPRRRPGRFAKQQQLSHRRRRSTNSSTNPYLDSLLARSVHALEMSNTLLQSSMSTQSAISSILRDSPVDAVLETSARGLSMRIQDQDNHEHPKWARDLAEITQSVDNLFSDEHDSSINLTSSVSCSLPTSSSPTMDMQDRAQTHKRRPSMLEFRSNGVDGTPHLSLAYQNRANLVAPPPRAMTQYVDVDVASASTTSNMIYLPSTLGARASASSLSLPQVLCEPQVAEKVFEPSTPAYHMLSSLASNIRTPPSASSSTSSTPNLLSRRNSKLGYTSSPKHRPLTTPKQIHTSLPPHRSVTPPSDESSSSDGCPAKRTVASLRKILDEQSPLNSRSASSSTSHLNNQRPRLRAPAFLPRTPAPLPDARTSTATASITRLYTKGKHTSSTRAGSPPPRGSALKGSRAGTPTPSLPVTPTRSASEGTRTTPTTNGNSTYAQTMLNVPSLLIRTFSTGSLSGSSAPSSGRSTPKRISFAELPEPYLGSGEMRERVKRRRERKRGVGGKTKAEGRNNSKAEDEEEGWWTKWILGATTSASAVSREERWGSRMPGAPIGYGPGDEWGV